MRTMSSAAVNDGIDVRVGRAEPYVGQSEPFTILGAEIAMRKRSVLADVALARRDRHEPREVTCVGGISRARPGDRDRLMANVDLLLAHVKPFYDKDNVYCNLLILKADSASECDLLIDTKSLQRRVRANVDDVITMSQSQLEDFTVEYDDLFKQYRAMVNKKAAEPPLPDAWEGGPPPGALAPPVSEDSTSGDGTTADGVPPQPIATAGASAGTFALLLVIALGIGGYLFFRAGMPT